MLYQIISRNNDVNGNPFRLIMVYDSLGNFLRAIEARSSHPNCVGKLKANRLPSIHVSPKEYKNLKFDIPDGLLEHDNNFTRLRLTERQRQSVKLTLETHGDAYLCLKFSGDKEKDLHTLSVSNGFPECFKYFRDALLKNHEVEYINFRFDCVSIQMEVVREWIERHYN